MESVIEELPYLKLSVNVSGCGYTRAHLATALDAADESQHRAGLTTRMNGALRPHNQPRNELAGKRISHRDTTAWSLYQVQRH
jgi:hypothetical protein